MMEYIVYSIDDIKNEIIKVLNNPDLIFTDEIIDNHNITSFSIDNIKIRITQFQYFFEGFEFEYVITSHKLDDILFQNYIDLRTHVMLEKCVESVIELLNFQIIKLNNIH